MAAMTPLSLKCPTASQDAGRALGHVLRDTPAADIPLVLGPAAVVE